MQCRDRSRHLGKAALMLNRGSVRLQGLFTMRPFLSLPLPDPVPGCPRTLKLNKYRSIGPYGDISSGLMVVSALDWPLQFLTSRS